MPDFDCPGADDMRAFVLGEVSDASAELLRRHLQSCPRCQAVAEQLDLLEDSVIHALRQAEPITVDLNPSTTGGGRGAASAPEMPGGPAFRLGGYDILGELGRGGMGVVYKARQTHLNRLVAIKMILHGDYADASLRARFRSEAEAIARLQHPNIVQVHEVGEHQGKPFFSLEFCPGGSLRDKQKGTPLLPQEAARLVETLARAMQAAHDKNVIHRDLKPANVLLSEEGTPKISDFGLAKKLDDQGQTVSGAILGTPSYMAPEQAAGQTRELGPACDVYALGAILYECLTGRPPFRAATVMDTLHQVVHDEPVGPTALQPKIPKDLETICLKCLRKEPTRRYATATGLADDLRRFQAGLPVAARPVGQLERGWRWCRRKPALAGSLATVLTLVATWATVSIVFAVQATRAWGEADGDASEADKQLAQAVRDRTEQQQVNVKLIRSEQEERQTNDRLLAQEARRLLSALALVKERPAINLLGPPTEQEIKAFGELAATPEKRLRLLFLEQALRSPITTRQLKTRAVYALHAAVGLDLERRLRVERMLVEVFEARGIAPEQQEEVAVLLATFAVHDRELAPRGAQALLQTLSRTRDPVIARQLAEALAAQVAWLEAKEAVDLLREATTRTSNRDAQGRLAQGLVAAAARLEPREAARVTGQAVLLLTEATTSSLFTPNPDIAPVPRALTQLLEGLEAAAPRLEPRDAAAAANALC